MTADSHDILFSIAPGIPVKKPPAPNARMHMVGFKQAVARVFGERSEPGSKVMDFTPEMAGPHARIRGLGFTTCLARMFE
jgi:hypothetical protein